MWLHPKAALTFIFTAQAEWALEPRTREKLTWNRCHLVSHPGKNKCQPERQEATSTLPGDIPAFCAVVFCQEHSVCGCGPLTIKGKCSISNTLPSLGNAYSLVKIKQLRKLLLHEGLAHRARPLLLFVLGRP